MSYELRGWVVKWGDVGSELHESWCCRSAVMVAGSVSRRPEVAIVRTHVGCAPRRVQVPVNDPPYHAWVDKHDERKVLAFALPGVGVYLAREGVFVRVALPALDAYPPAGADDDVWRLWRAGRDVAAGELRGWSGEYDMTGAVRHVSAGLAVFSAGVQLTAVALCARGAFPGSVAWLEPAAAPLPAPALPVRAAAVSAVVRPGEVGQWA